MKNVTLKSKMSKIECLNLSDPLSMTFRQCKDSQLELSVIRLSFLYTVNL